MAWLGCSLGQNSFAEDHPEDILRTETWKNKGKWSTLVLEQLSCSWTQFCHLQAQSYIVLSSGHWLQEGYQWDNIFLLNSVLESLLNTVYEWQYQNVETCQQK